jgi:very-short-patch-repair endonuclease
MPRDFHLDPIYPGERATRPLDSVIAELATEQRGVVGRDQLVQLGLSKHEIDDRVAASRLHPEHRGVYSVGHRRLSRKGRYLAAVLFGGEGAVLSDCAAADLWEMRAFRERRIEVTTPGHRRGDPTVRMRQRTLDPTDTTTRFGIPVTTPLRTLLDLAACVPARELERAIRQAVYRRLTTTALLAEAVDQRSGRRGTAKLRRALVNLGEAPGLTRSNLEQDFLRFLRRHRLAMPELNVEMWIDGQPIEADCVWPQHRLIIELDGRDAHDSTPAFESDRARDLALQAAGWRTGRVTSRRLRKDGAALASELRALTAQPLTWAK